MAIDLDELERLAQAATPGPWFHTTCDMVGTTESFFDEDFLCVCRTDVPEENKHSTDNAAYVMAACNAAPDLIAENRKFQECMRELERQNDFFLKALKENFMCPYSRCKYDDGSELDEWECSAENNRECWIKAAKEAGE